MLIMKCPSSNGGGDEQTTCNVTIVNLSLCMDIEIVKEAIPPAEVQQPEPIDLPMIRERYRYATEHRTLSCRSYHPNASPFGQALFRLLVKRFGDPAIIWQNKGDQVAINILRQVVIDAPYATENIRYLDWNPKLAICVQGVVQNFCSKQF
nr:IP06575p [Drosophila melanogaster]